MMKWDALERAAAKPRANSRTMSEPISDSGAALGHDIIFQKSASFCPIEHDRIVIGAERNWALKPNDTASLAPSAQRSNALDISFPLGCAIVPTHQVWMLEARAVIALPHNIVDENTRQRRPHIFH